MIFNSSSIAIMVWLQNSKTCVIILDSWKMTCNFEVLLIGFSCSSQNSMGGVTLVWWGFFLYSYIVCLTMYMILFFITKLSFHNSFHFNDECWLVLGNIQECEFMRGYYECISIWDNFNTEFYNWHNNPTQIIIFSKWSFIQRKI